MPAALIIGASRGIGHELARQYVADGWQVLVTVRNNTSGSLYRASKAALNSVLVDVAHHIGPLGAVCVTLHPGWVRTDMGGEHADIEVEESVSGIRATLAGLRASDNGRFFNYDGTALAW
ncbi:MAG: hypothetical protein RL748_3326 [Pseudomonadota bacterium]|jgi:NAD(P)-dependent dehydrogenase (short-subunit alcohol dehydrogenase family)